MPKNTNASQSHPKNSRRAHPASRSNRARPNYHRIKCNVCRHPDHAAIDQDFLRWQSPEKLARQYGLANHTSIYRHVHATGLYARRRLTICTALESIIEHAERVVPTATEVVKAVKIYSQFNDRGQWVEPAKHRIIQRIKTSAPEINPRRSKINRKPGKIEHGATR
jgi:hypothetical protein